jgi:hypothetical protein
MELTVQVRKLDLVVLVVQPSVITALLVRAVVAVAQHQAPTKMVAMAAMASMAPAVAAVALVRLPAVLVELEALAVQDEFE